MEKKTFFSWVTFLLITVCLLWGCSDKGIKTTLGDPEILYKQGLTQFNKRDYKEALKKFEQLKASFPDSPPFTVWAELKIGDCHFLNGSYVEAVAAYEEFKKIHPTHEEIPYVQYQIASAYFKQIRSLDQDQTFTQKALSNFEYLIANYPASLFTEKAGEKVSVCKKRLADHEFYIGSYYYKRGKFQAAAVRFQGLIDKFPTTPDTDKALILLGKSYLELNQGGKAVETFNKIVNEYPKSSHYKEARSLLDQGIKEKAIPLPKAKTKESKKKEEKEEAEPDRVYLAKFDDEGRQSVFVAPSLPVTRESGRAIPPQERVETLIPSWVGEPVEEDRAKTKSSPLPQEVKPTVEVKPEEEKRFRSIISSDSHCSGAKGNLLRSKRGRQKDSSITEHSGYRPGVGCRADARGSSQGYIYSSSSRGETNGGGETRRGKKAPGITSPGLHSSDPKGDLFRSKRDRQADSGITGPPGCSLGEA